MPMQSLPTPPSREDPANFRTRADQFLAALATFATEANALETNVNAKEVSAVSAASTATTQASTATSAASTATTAAATATTKAGEASASASAAAASAASIGAVMRDNGEAIAGISLNTLITTGVYRLGSTYTDGPVGITGPGSNLLVVRGDTDNTAAQFLITYPDGRVFVRQGYIGSGESWTPWREMHTYISTFAAHAADNQTSGAVGTIVQFGVLDSYTGGASHFSTTYHQYFAQRSGVHDFEFRVRALNSDTSSHNFGVALLRTTNGGSTVTVVADHLATIRGLETDQANMSRKVSMQAGDTVHVVTTTALGTIQIQAAGTFFSGAFIGG